MPSPRELRALADQLEALNELELAAEKAKADNENDPGHMEKRTAAQEAIDALAAARMEFRGSPVAAVNVEAGSMTIIPPGVGTRGNPSGVTVQTDQEG